MSWDLCALLIKLCCVSGGLRLFTFHAINLITGLVGVGFRILTLGIFVQTVCVVVCVGVCSFLKLMTKLSTLNNGILY